MLAWLALTPKNSENTNEQLYGRDLPSVPFEYGHLPQFLLEIGIAGRGFGELAPLTFTEIRAWEAAMQFNLSRFEFTAIRSMSAAYVGIANNREAECPIDSEHVRASINEANAAAWRSLGTSNG